MIYKFKSSRNLFGTSALAAIALMPGQALSQDVATAHSGVEEIIVTAQKREQRMQDVPVAVTAVTADALQVNRVTNVMDLNGLAPGLLARTNAGSIGSPSYSMRGIFASASDPAQDRQVATYIDGVYIGGVRGAVFDLPDIERVEVLRGPQGTLFGRNATAGAVSITTRDPAGELGARVEATLGTRNTLRTRVTVDTPQIGMFSAFATYVHDERRGDVRNLGAGTPLDFTSPFHDIIGKTSSPRWLGSKNAESVFAALKAEPSDSFDITYKFDWTKNESTPEARVPLWNGALVNGIIALQGDDTTYGGYVMPEESSRPKRPDTVNNAFAAPGFNKTSGHVITVNWQATDSLSFKNVTAWRSASALGVSSVMGAEGLTVTPGVIAYLGSIPLAPGVSVPGYTPAQAGQLISGYAGVNYGKYSQFSNELQANYQSDLLTLTAGALYFDSDELSAGLPGSPTNFGLLVGLSALQAGNFPVYLSNLSLDTTQPFLLGNIQEKHQSTESMAVYAQAEIHATPQLDVVLGGRVTRDKKEQTFIQGGTYDPATNTIVGTSSVTTPFKKTKPTYSLGLNYKATDDLLLYGKYSTAYLSGGASGPLIFEPETVKSWEAGIKSEWFDRRLRFNLALYTATYNNSQAAQSGSNVQDPACGGTGSCAAYGVVVISNGKVRARGVEAEVTVAPAQGLTIGGSLSYNDTKWLSPSPQITDGGRPVGPTAVPEWMGGVNAQYVTPPLFEEATLMFRIDAIYQGKYRNSPFLDLATHPATSASDPAQATWEFTQSRWVLNGRVALRDFTPGPLRGEIGLWARNLTNNKDVSYLLHFGSQNTNASFQQGRTVGLDFILEY